MKKTSLIMTALLAALAIAAFAASDKIVKQERRGATLIVRYESGRVETNSLFLAMSPDVKKELARINGERIIVDTIKNVAADTRSNIPEASALSDVEIAGLYLQQVKKSSDALESLAPTNTLEYLIGAGMRQDLNKKENTK